MRGVVWAVLVLMIAVGLVGVLRSGPYLPESAALLLIGLGLALHRLTWGRD